MTGPDAPSIGGDTAESQLGPVAMNVGFQNTAQEIVVIAVEMRAFWPDLDIRTFLFRPEKNLDC
jgi:hypothetical protein